MKYIRWFLGKVILTLNFLTPPKGIKRSEEAQQQVNQKASAMALYQFQACPFCVKVRRAMKRQSVTMELRDTKNDATHREELLAGGGAVKVPCLRIDKAGESTWMYESSDIIAFLKKEFP